MTLVEIQDRLKDLVSAAELLTGRTVLIEAKDNLVNQLEVALQQQSLAVVIALASGKVKDGSLPGRAAWEETFEIVIHRGLLDADDVPSTIAVLEQLRSILHGSLVAGNTRAAGIFSCNRHDLRDGGDGSYARVLTVSVTIPVAA